MSDEEKKVDDSTQEDLEKSKSTLKEKGADELIDIIHSTRNEAKTYRLELKDMKSKLETLMGEKEKEVQEKKLAEGKKDEVIIELKGKIDDLSKKAKEWDDYNTQRRNSIKEKLGEDWLDSFNVVPLNDLELLAAKFNNTKTAIDTDTGKTKKTGTGKLEALRKDLATAVEKKDLPAQLTIQRMIDEELRKK